MTIHLIKLSVGPESIADLEHWQERHIQQMQKLGLKPELIHTTRNTPKRAEALLNGGSIYWVIKGWVCARQKLLEIRPLVINEEKYCGLVYAPEMIRVSPRPHRPFQGWRYLKPEDAPADLSPSGGDEEMPDDMRRELIALGLL